MIRETDPLGYTTTFAYDAVGNRIRRVNARGQCVTYSYNANGELVGEQYPDGHTHAYDYDLAGNRTSLSDATGATTFAYDSRNLVTSVTDPDGKTVSYTYDALRRRAMMTDPEGGVTSYSYDAADRVTSVVNPQGKVTTLAYDAAGRKIRMEHANGSLTTYTYDCAARLTHLEHRKSDATLLKSFTYIYDEAGNRTRAEESSGDVTTWTYDRTYQLTHEERSGGISFDVAYTYDAAGNRVTQDDSGAMTTYTYDEANRLLTSEDVSGVTTFTYDEDGNRTQKETPSDVTYYTWDEDSRLVSSEPVAGVVTLTYRADGRRVRKEMPSESKKFIYDFKRLLQETDDTGTVEQEYTSTLSEWGELVSEYDGTDTLYHQYDAIGSTDALLDDAETATDRYAHRAFGIEESHTGTSENPFTFVGAENYYRDPELELYFAGARYYDPQAGRWLSEDPKGLEGGDENLYRYVRNNPVNAVDPSGMRIERDWKDGCLVWNIYADKPIVGHEVDGEDTIPAGKLLGAIKINTASFGSGYRDVKHTPAFNLIGSAQVEREREIACERAEIEARNRSENGRVFQSVEYWFEAPWDVNGQPRIRGVATAYESPREMSPERLQHFRIQNGRLPWEAREPIPSPPVERPEAGPAGGETTQLPERSFEQYDEAVEQLGDLTPRAIRQIRPSETFRREMVANQMIADIWTEVADQLQDAIVALGLQGAGLAVAAVLEVKVVQNGVVQIVRKVGGVKRAVAELPATAVEKIRNILRKRKGTTEVTDQEVAEAVLDCIEAGASEQKLSKAGEAAASGRDIRQRGGKGPVSEGRARARHSKGDGPDVDAGVSSRKVAPGSVVGLSKARQIASYSDTDLSRFALDFRKSERIGRKGNVVVIEYELNGVTQPLKAFHTVGGGRKHGEFIAKKALPEGATLKRLFSERQPCQLEIPNCDRMLARDFPDAEITFLVEYGDEASRKLGNAALDSILRGLGL